MVVFSHAPPPPRELFALITPSRSVTGKEKNLQSSVTLNTGILAALNGVLLRCVWLSL